MTTPLTPQEIDALPELSIVEERSRFPTVFIRKEGSWRGTNGSIVANSRFFLKGVVYLIREGEPQ